MRPPVTRRARNNLFVRMAVVTVAWVTGVAVLSGVLSTPAVQAQVPEPTITVSTSYGSIWAENFTPDNSLTISINSNVVGTWPTDEWGNFDGNNYGLSFDVVPGDTVEATDGSSTATVVLANLSASFDESTLTVSGTTDTPDTPAGPMVMVNFGPAWRSVPVSGGAWVADFGNPAIPGEGDGILTSFGAAMGGHASVADGEGDTTQWNWSSASIHASTVGDYLWVNDFAPGPVSLTIGGTPVDPSPVADEYGHFWLDFTGTGTDLQSGQEIVAYQDPWTAEVTLVDLAITDVNTATGVVSGIAPAGALVDVHAWTKDGGYASRVATAASGNIFSVDFSVVGGPDSWGQDVLALDPGTDLRAHIYDDRDLPEHDATISDWHIPDPRFKARVDDNGFSGWEWAPDSTVTVTIDNDPTLVYDFPTDEWGNFDGTIDADVAINQYVEATDGVSTKDMTIRNLVVTDVDVDNDIVSGTATAGDEIHVSLHSEFGSYRNVTADGAGNWIADFSVPWQDQPFFDIVPGTGGNAHYWEPDGDETQRTFRVANPYITAQVIHEEIWATDFPDEPEGQVLYYRLDDPGTAEIEFETDMPLIVSNGWTEAGDHSFGRFDVQAGWVLTVRNRPFDQPLGDGMERVLDISHIEVTSVDGDADVIGGYADPLEGDYICVWSQDAQLCSDEASFTWNGDGTWSADFGAIGSDVAPGHWNSASQYSADGDETHYWWNLPPWVVVELAEEDEFGNPIWPERVRAESWTGPVVTLEINDAYVTEWTVTGDGHYTFELPGVDLDPGDVVTLSDASDTKTIEVRPLTIDQINLAGDTPPNTVFGSADPYQNLRVQASATVGGWWAERWVNADSAGDYLADFGNPGNGWREQWTADFGGAEGLGRNMYAEFYDDDNDRVETFVCRGVPRIEIARSDGRVDAIDFPEGALVNLEIDDPATAESPDFSDSGVVVVDPNDPCKTIVSFDLGEFEVPDNAQVAASDGTSEGTVTTDVVAFTIDVVDPDADTVAGTAPIGTEVLVEADGNNWRYVTAEDDGTGVGYWVADFSQQGPEPGEEHIIDLGPGSSGRAIVLDSEGNATVLSWRISAAQFQVSPSDENIWGSDFEPNALLTITVNGSGVPGGPIYTDEWGSFGFGFDPTELDIAAGDLVVVFDGSTTKDHTVTDLVVTVVDPVADVVSGTAAAGSQVGIWVHDVDNVWRTVTADGSGNWSVDFGVPGDDPGEENTANLQPGSNGNSSQCDGDSDCTTAGWSVVNPQLGVTPQNENIWGSEFEPNALLTITVNGSGVPGGPYYTDEWGSFGFGFDPNELGITAGDYIVVFDGVSTKDHTITDLVVTGVDVDNDVVSGTAEPGTSVDVWDHHEYHNITVVACDDSVEYPCNGDVLGTWHADFSAVFDIQPGHQGSSSQCDADSDCTLAEWFAQTPPWISTTWGGTLPGATQVDIIQGWEWPEGEPIHITVAHVAAPGTPLFEWEMTVGEYVHADPPWWFEYRNDLGGAFELHLDGVFDLGPGHVITVASVDWEKSVEVVQVTIDVIDLENDIVQGSAPDGTAVDVWAGFEDDEQRSAYRITGGEAAWSVDFGVDPGGDEWGTANLDLGWVISTDVWDEDGDTSVIDRYVPNPTFSVDTPSDVWSTGDRWQHWAEGTPVEIVVDDDDDLGNGDKFTHGAALEMWGEAPWEIGFNTNVEPNEIYPGDTVYVTIDGITKVLHVEDIWITNVDEDFDIVGGYAPAGERVEVNADAGDGSYGASRSVDADSVTGYWQADFSQPGDEEHEQDTFDIGPGTGVGAQVFDDDGDSTHDGTYIEEPIIPIFSVRMSEQQVHGYEWPFGAEVTLTIDDPSNGAGVDYTESGFAEPAEWDPEQSFVWFAPGENGFEILPGFHVAMTDGETVKIHDVADLIVTDVDRLADTVSGLASPGAWVDVHIHDSGPDRSVQADGNGFWMADFSQPGDEEHEQDTFDIDFGTYGEALESDDDGDNTQVEWRLVNPTFKVSATGNWVDGSEWAPDTPITITFDDDDDPATVLFTADAHTNSDGWFEIGWGEEFTIEPGMFVTVTDQATSKTHWVTGLTVTGVDDANDAVSGIATPFAEVVVDIEAQLEPHPEAVVTADADGNWVADFSGVYDLVPGTQGGAHEPDDDGDSTSAVWRVPGDPEFGVSATHDWIEFYDFAGDTITFTIDDGAGDLYEETIDVEPYSLGWIHLIQDYDVQVGDFVTVTDGITTKTTYLAPLTIAVDQTSWVIGGTSDPEVEIDVFGFHPDFGGFGEQGVFVDEYGGWSFDVATAVDGLPPEIPDGAVFGAGQRDDDSDRTIVFWDPAVVEGHVLVDGEPVVGAEVFFQGTIGAQHTCTDSDGYYVFENVSVVKALVSEGVAATGRAVNADLGCSNPDFLDANGIPLVTSVIFGPFDLQDGYEYIGFDVERAAAYQQVVVEEFDGSQWVPVDGVIVQAFDRNDPEFIANFGTDPDPGDYQAIWESGIGQIAYDFTGVYVVGNPGSVELRYAGHSDVLILVEYVDGSILGDQTGAGEFADRGDGVLVGPTIVFPNKPPEIISIDAAFDPIEIGTETVVTVAYTDPNVHDTHTATIDWGDGTVTEEVAADGSFAGAHTYAEPGVYVVVATVTDSGGLSDSEEFRYIVAYDPNGGFVTGGGWIDSPEGAYAPDQTLTGQANFGFVSKYKKGAATPEGNTEFQFHAGGLNFHSNDYEWLVVAGARAMFKGTGTINGDGEYGFLISAIDAAKTPSTDVDLFRMKIWDKATEAVIYDNQIGDDDDADPTTQIAGGNIAVHDGKKVK